MSSWIACLFVVGANSFTGLLTRPRRGTMVALCRHSIEDLERLNA